MARSSTSFQPGTSGNPGGRPKGLSEVIALAREHTELAITTLVSGISKSQVSRLCTEIEPRRMTEQALTAVIQEAYPLRAGAVRVARSSTSFQPGTSGNPGGRPKGLSEVIALAREHTELAITTLVDIARQPKAAPAARVAAASALLDRGWGKPAQAIQATTTNASAVVMLGKGDPVEIAEHYRRIMDGTLVDDDDS